MPWPHRSATTVASFFRRPTYAQEQEKIERRLPAAVRFVAEHRLNEQIRGECDEIGHRPAGRSSPAARCGRWSCARCADAFSSSKVSLYVLNVNYPLVPEEWVSFCRGGAPCCLRKKGRPEFIEQAATQILHRHEVNTRLLGKGVLPVQGEYSVDVLRARIEVPFRMGTVASHCAHWQAHAVARMSEKPLIPTARLAKLVPPRPAGLCTGCPERPLFTALKLMQREIGPLHINADIGCHSFATLPPFDMGNSILGYGLGAASGSALATVAGRRAVSIMGDGGFWHNGLTTGIGNAVFNRHDDVTLIIDNGYSAATGGQNIPSSRAPNEHRQGNNRILDAVKGVRVKWIRRVHTYDMQGTLSTLREALTTTDRGPKVILAEGECQLNRQRRVRPLMNKSIQQGKRIVRERFGVDPDTCTGDHSCIRLSGCPSLTIRENPDPLRTDPIAHVDNSLRRLRGGVRREVSHAAVLSSVVLSSRAAAHNPSRWGSAVEPVSRVRHRRVTAAS